MCVKLYSLFKNPLPNWSHSINSMLPELPLHRHRQHMTWGSNTHLIDASFTLSFSVTANNKNKECICVSSVVIQLLARVSNAVTFTQLLIRSHSHMLALLLTFMKWKQSKAVDMRLRWRSLSGPLFPMWIPGFLSARRSSRLYNGPQTNSTSFKFSGLCQWKWDPPPVSGIMVNSEGDWCGRRRESQAKRHIDLISCWGWRWGGGPRECWQACSAFHWVGGGALTVRQDRGSSCGTLII